MSEPLQINKFKINAGEKAALKIPVGELPSGVDICLRAFVYRAKEAGETMLVMAGVHGDEINGVETVRRTIHQKLFDNLKRGTVIVVPLLNIFGFLNFSRAVPDGKDVNRSFPGSKKGSLAARVAYVLSNEILPHVDFGVDFHTGGSSRYNYPQIRYTKEDQTAAELANIFAAPFTIASSTIKGSLRRTAADRNVPMLVFEGGESTRLDQLSIDSGLIGIQRILAHKGMITNTVSPSKSIFIQKKSWIRAPHAGMFRWLKNSGEAVTKGETIGVINDPYGQEEIKIQCDKNGYIIGHNNAPVVSLGDALFHIGR
ncbi:MAG: succinylglutamate desuccinylase/aspartoacylase family protein [Saprospiraceae bacterium]